MEHSTKKLNGDFGIVIEGVTRSDLADENFRREAYDLWVENGGLLAVRGGDLADSTPEELYGWSTVFGDVEHGNFVAREDKMVGGLPILRIGNVKDKSGKQIANFAKVAPLKSDADIRYNPETRRPVWHTDSTFRQQPPIGSVFQCRIAPPSGGATLFADMRSAYRTLDEETKAKLDGLEAVCSLAHHDKKISLYSPGYPTLNEAQRAANPPNRVPLVLKHPVSGEPALYGLNSSTCAIVPKGKPIANTDLDVWDLEGKEDDSVQILRGLLPYITGPEFTVKWDWQPGDIVAWDNRCTMHAASGFDHDKHEREMWRLTLLERSAARAAAE